MDCVSVSSPAAYATGVTVLCPAGYVATGGSCYNGQPEPFDFSLNCAPSGNTGWRCSSSAGACFQVHAKCCKLA